MEITPVTYRSVKWENCTHVSYFEHFFVLKDKIISKNGRPALGETIPYRNSDGEVRASNINISRSALRNWHTLAATIGNELNQYYYFYSGAYDRWEKHYGPIRATAIAEYKSHYWEMQWGGLPIYEEMESSIRTYRNK